MRIITKPLAGLSNKLRVIESVVSLAKDLDSAVEVIWVPDHQMVAAYKDLFEPCSLFQVTDYNRYRYCRSSFSLKNYKKPFSKIINFAYGIDVAFNEIDIQKVRAGQYDIAAMINEKKTAYIDTCHNFYPYRYNFSWVKPLPIIALALDRFLEMIGNRNCIGIHVRRTDNISSIENSPDYLFEEMIRNELDRDSSVVFFLATDDENTQAHFVKLFGADKVLVRPKRFGRNSVVAIQDAVVDWFLLSKCKKLYCSYFSSFSETAASISKCPAITLRV